MYNFIVLGRPPLPNVNVLVVCFKYQVLYFFQPHSSYIVSWYVLT